MARRNRIPPYPPAPPIEMPPARTVRLEDRGEFFLRDSGGDGPAVMLLHGWIATADLNWWGAYGDLIDAGYRMLAIDHRGHGRGLRPLTRFRLVDCAADAAAVLRELDLKATVVGYSMGGAIAQLVARDHPDVTDGVVLSGTAQHWQDPKTRWQFRTMGAFGLALALAPRAMLRSGLKQSGIEENERTAWLQSELLRHSARDIAEAGRELGRFDSRSWLGHVEPPLAVVVTTRDELVPVPKQRELAAAGKAQVFEAPISHMEVGWNAAAYNPALLQAITAVRASEAVHAA
jgi:3-oxoadipate enol-lactonase